MRLKRKSSGHYTFGEFEILHDIPQSGVSVGTGCGASRWNVYKRGCDEPEDRFVTLAEVRLWLASAQHGVQPTADADKVVIQVHDIVDTRRGG